MTVPADKPRGNVLERAETNQTILSAPKSRIKRLAAESLWVGFGQASSAAGAVFGVMILTRALAPQSYGELALGMTFSTLANQVIIGPAAGAVNRFFAPASEAGSLSPFFSAVRMLLARGTFLLGGLTTIGAVAAALSGNTEWISLVLAAFVFSLLSGYSSVLDGIQNAARHRIVVAGHQGVGQWVRLLGALALIGLWGPTSINALWGYSLGAALVFLSQLTFFRRHITTGISAVSQAASNTANWAAKLTDYAHPFASWGLFTWAQMASDRWAVEIFASTAQVGLYTALYQIGFYPVTLLSTAMVQFAAPILFSRAGDGKVPARIAQTARLIWLLLAASLGATLVGTIFSWFFHDFIFSLFVPIQYRSISFLLPVTVLAGGLFAAGQVAVLQVLSRSASRSLIAPKIGTAILGVILNFAGVYWFGLPGLVWAGAVFALVYLGWILCLCRSQAGTVPVDPESSKTL